MLVSSLKTLNNFRTLSAGEFSFDYLRRQFSWTECRDEDKSCCHARRPTLLSVTKSLSTWWTLFYVKMQLLM